MSHIPRLLLALAAVLLLLGVTVHTLAFGKVASVLAASNLPAFYGASLKTFWLNDSADMTILALVCAALALKPGLAARPIVILLAAIPAAIGALLFCFVGYFVAVPLVAAIAGLILAAGLFWPATREQTV